MHKFRMYFLNRFIVSLLLKLYFMKIQTLFINQYIDTLGKYIQIPIHLLTVHTQMNTYCMDSYLWYILSTIIQHFSTHFYVVAIVAVVAVAAAGCQAMPILAKLFMTSRFSYRRRGKLERILIAMFVVFNACWLVHIYCCWYNIRGQSWYT